MPTRETAPAGAPCWVDLMTSDPARARTFYSELFGWTAEDPAEEFGGYFTFTKDGVQVAGCMPKPDEAVPDGWSVYLATPDAEKTVAAAVDHDAETQDGVPITANTLYDGDSERPVMDGDKKVGFAPPNEDDHDYGEIDVQEAMNKSVNSVFAQMGIDVGMPEVMKVAADLGMDTEGEQAVPAQTLGSMGASPLEMAGVYATFDNHGKKVTPAIVKSVEHKDRKV